MGGRLGYTESSSKQENIDFQKKLKDFLDNYNSSQAIDNAKLKEVYDAYGDVKKKAQSQILNHKDEMILTISEKQMNNLGTILSVSKNNKNKFTLGGVLNGLESKGIEISKGLTNLTKNSSNSIDAKKDAQIARLKAQNAKLKKQLAELTGQENVTKVEKPEVVEVISDNPDTEVEVTSATLIEGNPIIPKMETTEEKILEEAGVYNDDGTNAVTSIVSEPEKKEVIEKMENNSEFATKVLEGTIGLLISLFGSKEEVEDFKKENGGFEEPKYKEYVSFKNVKEGYKDSLFFDLKKEEITKTDFEDPDDETVSEMYNFGIKNIDIEVDGYDTYMKVKFPEKLTITQSIDLAILHEAVKKVSDTGISEKELNKKLLELVRKGDKEVIAFVKLVSEGENEEAKKILENLINIKNKIVLNEKNIGEYIISYKQDGSGILKNKGGENILKFDEKNINGNFTIFKNNKDEQIIFDGDKILTYKENKIFSTDSEILSKNRILLALRIKEEGTSYTYTYKVLVNKLGNDIFGFGTLYNIEPLKIPNNKGLFLVNSLSDDVIYIMNESGKVYETDEGKKRFSALGFGSVTLNENSISISEFDNTLNIDFNDLKDENFTTVDIEGNEFEKMTLLLKRNLAFKKKKLKNLMTIFGNNIYKVRISLIKEYSKGGNPIYELHPKDFLEKLGRFSVDDLNIIKNEFNIETYKEFMNIFDLIKNNISIEVMKEKNIKLEEKGIIINIDTVKKYKDFYLGKKTIEKFFPDDKETSTKSLNKPKENTGKTLDSIKEYFLYLPELTELQKGVINKLISKNIKIEENIKYFIDNISSLDDLNFLLQNIKYINNTSELSEFSFYFNSQGNEKDSIETIVTTFGVEDKNTLHNFYALLKGGGDSFNIFYDLFTENKNVFDIMLKDEEVFTNILHVLMNFDYDSLKYIKKEYDITKLEDFIPLLIDRNGEIYIAYTSTNISKIKLINDYLKENNIDIINIQNFSKLYDINLKSLKILVENNILKTEEEFIDNKDLFMHYEKIKFLIDKNVINIIKIKDYLKIGTNGLEEFKTLYNIYKVTGIKEEEKINKLLGIYRSVGNNFKFFFDLYEKDDKVFNYILKPGDYTGDIGTVFPLIEHSKHLKNANYNELVEKIKTIEDFNNFIILGKFKN